MVDEGNFNFPTTTGLHQTRVLAQAVSGRRRLKIIPREKVKVAANFLSLDRLTLPVTVLDLPRTSGKVKTSMTTNSGTGFHSIPSMWLRGTVQTILH